MMSSSSHDSDGRRDGVDRPAEDLSAELRSDVVAGQAVYTRLTLAFYDVMVLGLSNRWIWRCPTPIMRRLYDSSVSSRHLDIGVGTGYFLDHATWPDPSPTITLVDLNVNSLNASAGRIRRLRPHTARCNVLGELGDLPGAPFDSVGLNYLFHCMPGTLEDKAHQVFAGLADLLAPGCVVFGSTILAPSLATPRPARKLMGFYNRKGIFHNTEDHLDGLVRALDKAFAEQRVSQVGSVATFVARTARPT